MLRSPGRSDAPAPAPKRPFMGRATNRPNPQETLALVEGAGEAFETLQLQLLGVLQKAKSSLQEAQQERAQLQVEVAALEKEKDGWSQRARKAEATLEQANQVLQTQQGILEKAILREREAVQRAYMLELKLRQSGATQRPA
ncbi:MAG: hypothetical protein DCF30_14245 [Hyphomicrobiales bacterium]|nr:MAG: hypothetical protein DCF30_14245 [Hyphomicrobiales bacterium]